MKNVLCIAGLGLGLSVAACRSQPSADVASSPPAAPTVLAPAAAAMQVAAVRCQHETACSNVGPGRPYATTEACMAELTQSAQTDLETRVCPLGVDPRQLANCTGQFRRESCHPLAPLTRMVACAPASLCARPGGESFSASDAYGVQ